ncbi:unnamed protein product [Orchesella dallaii]|uniref:Uncharacterized protein n=1 Tax=Orchesella dallaii TaxID=48710 RepID=A0ABP1RSL8_9HEXA
MAKVKDTREKYYNMDPNNPALSLKMKNLVLKSKRSKAYRDSQNSLIVKLKKENAILNSQLAQKTESEQKLVCELKEKNKIIEEQNQLIIEKDDIFIKTLGLNDKKELTAATSLIQLKMQGASRGPVAAVPSSRPSVGKGRVWYLHKGCPVAKKTSSTVYNQNAG